MRSFITYFILAICISLMIVGSSPALSRKMFTLLIENAQQYGDMYRMSNLREFKKKSEVCPLPGAVKKGSTDLYIIGDSYFEVIRPERYSGLNKYHFVNYKHQLQTHLDSTKKNILIVESVERNLRVRFIERADSPNIIIHKDGPDKLIEYYKSRNESKFIFNAEKNFQKMLFNDPFSLFFKEIKASLNYHVFNRIDKNVLFSSDKKYLFYYEETDTTEANEIRNSAFNTISQQLLDSIVEKMNTISEYYISQGFDEVYFVTPPNKVSVVEPGLGNYNHLIERIRDNVKLKAKFIDLYSLLKKDPTFYYSPNDTHWNCEGQQLWVNYANTNILNR